MVYKKHFETMKRWSINIRQLLTKFLCSERIFHYFQNFLRIIDSLPDTSLFKSLQNWFIFSLHILIQINYPTGMEWFQIWQLWRYFDEVKYLNWSPHINHISQTLVKANAMLCKLRHFVNVATIKSIYYTIFHSHL